MGKVEQMRQLYNCKQERLDLVKWTMLAVNPDQSPDQLATRAVAIADAILAELDRTAKENDEVVDE